MLGVTLTEIELLVRNLQDDNRDTRSSAALKLGKLGQSATVDDLIQALMIEPDLNVQEDITWALSQFNHAAVSGLFTCLEDSSEEIRHRAVHTLGKLNTEKAVDALIRALRDVSPKVRYKATVALGQIKDVRALPALIKTIGDPLLEVSQGASDALTEFDSAAIDHLVVALEDRSDTIKEAAANLLGVIASPLAVEPLIAALSDLSTDVRVAAAISLGLIGDERAMIPLHTLRDDPDVRVKAAASKALELLG